MDRYELNGAPVGAGDLDILGRVALGHYTTMHVRNGGVRGFGLHVRRLQDSARELFGCELDGDMIRSHVRHALDGTSAAVVRVNVFVRDLDLAPASNQVDIMVTVGAPREHDGKPLKVRSVRYERFMPHVKHIGIGFGRILHGRRAVAEGWDDVLFLDSAGRIEEGTSWNIGFFDGTSVIWPNAPALPGIAMQLVQLGLAQKGIASETRSVPISEVASFRAAFLTNSLRYVSPIAQIDDTEFPRDDEFMARLTDCHRTNPEEAI